MATQLSTPVLSLADRGQILAVLQTFSGANAQSWLQAGHPAATGSLPGNWRAVSALPSSQVIGAVAASAPNHCLDAWTFLARTFQALSAGDGHGARHAAYYSQLRSSLSILANLGVGIFNGINFSVTMDGRVLRLDPPRGQRVTDRERRRGLGTHEVVWQALRTFVSGANSAAVFLDQIKMSGRAVGDILDEIWPGSRTAMTATRILESWGLDLRRGKDEHKFRNISSYQPHLLNPINDQAEDCLKFLQMIWPILEPASEHGFDLLDKHLIRSLAWDVYESSSPDVPKSESLLAKNYEKLGARLQRSITREFLIGELEPAEIKLLALARSRAEPATPLEMTSRALILARIATGFTRSSFEQAGNPDMLPWITTMAIDRGFVPSGEEIASPLGLWTDIQVALEDLEVEPSRPVEDYFSWLGCARPGVPILTQAERVAVWALA